MELDESFFSCKNNFTQCLWCCLFGMESNFLGAIVSIKHNKSWMEDGDMTIALGSSGDKGGSRGDAAAATGVVPPQVPPALGRAPRHPVVCGSHFWALAGGSSDDDSDGEEPEVRVSSPMPAPSSVTVGDFICAALASGSAGSCRSASRARSTFAPGGRGPRWLSSSKVSVVRRPPSLSSTSLIRLKRIYNF
jgi:hypothetical protein